MNKIEIIRELGAGIAQQGLNLLEILSEKTGTGKEIVSGVSRLARGESRTAAQSADHALGAPSLADKLEAGAISGRQSLASSASEGSRDVTRASGSGLDGLLETSFNRRRFLTTSGTGIAAAQFGALDSLKSFGSTLAPDIGALRTVSIPITVATRAAVADLSTLGLTAWNKSAHLTEVVRHAELKYEWERFGKYFGEPEPKLNWPPRKSGEQLVEINAPDRVSSIGNTHLREQSSPTVKSIGDRTSTAASHSYKDASEINGHPSSVKVADGPTVSREAPDVSDRAIKVSPDEKTVSPDAAEIDMVRRRLVGGAAALGLGKTIGLPKLGGEFGRAVSSASPFEDFLQGNYSWVPPRELAMVKAGFKLDLGPGNRVMEAARKAMADANHGAIVETRHGAMVESTHAAAFDPQTTRLNHAEQLPSRRMHAAESADEITVLPKTHRLSGNETHVSGAMDLMRTNANEPIVHAVKLEPGHSKLASLGQMEPAQSSRLAQVELARKPLATSNSAEGMQLTRPAEVHAETSSNSGFLSRWSARKRGVVEEK